jgi:hypothetical protein
MLHVVCSCLEPACLLALEADNGFSVCLVKRFPCLKTFSVQFCYCWCAGCGTKVTSNFLDAEQRGVTSCFRSVGRVARGYPKAFFLLESAPVSRHVHVQTRVDCCARPLPRGDEEREKGKSLEMESVSSQCYTFMSYFVFVLILPGWI